MNDLFLKSRRILVAGLAVLVFFSTTMTAYAAEDSSLTVDPYEGVSRLEYEKEKGFAASSYEVSGEALYAPTDEVELIIELDQQPLIDYANESETDISKFAKTQRGQSLIAQIDNAQGSVTSALEKALGRDGFETLFEYSYVMSGLSIRTEYQNLSRVREIKGIKTAYVAKTFDPVVPAMDSSSGQVHVGDAYAASFRGEGQRIAVIDTGLDDTHEAFSQDPVDLSQTVGQSDIDAILSSNTLAAERIVGDLSAADVYRSAKVPYAFDYADRDTNARPESQANVASVNHGTHVASTAAGYALDTEGGIVFSGIAPQAQILVFKVFRDGGGGASDANIVAALEDAVILESDVINMSLGSSAGFSKDNDSSMNAMYTRVAESGIILDVSAGNEGTSGENNQFGYSLNQASDIDNGVVGAPSTYAASLSVASINNTHLRAAVIEDSAGNLMKYTDTKISFTTLKSLGNISYVAAGIGSSEDFNGIDVSGKIALIQRGSLNFEDKVTNAAIAGAIGVIVYDNVNGALINMSSEANTIPAIFISKADGETLLGLSDPYVIATGEYAQFVNPQGNLPSDFSSIGVTSDLKLKPEIAAPGGGIWGAVPSLFGDPAYTSMNGTSMAAPHVTGASALVRQFVETTTPGLSEAEIVARVNTLLMSTAVPVVDGDGVIVTPRKQGSGMIHIANAIATPAYLSTPGTETERPKIELGDDPSRSGVYTLSFAVTNTSATPVSYDIDTDVLAPFAASDGNRMFITDDSIELDTVNSGMTNITVPAGETKTVTVVVNLPDVSALVAKMPNGFYVDGFVNLSSPSLPDLSIPFLGFYGDWTKAPIFDHASWLDMGTDQYNETAMLAHEAGTPIAGGLYLLGVNLLDGTQTRIDANALTISPNGDMFADALWQVNMSQIRNSALNRYEIHNAAGELVYEYELEHASKTLFNNNYGIPVSADMFYPMVPWRANDLSGAAVPDGRYTFKASAQLDYTAHASANDNDSFSFSILVDRVAPELSQSTLRLVQESGRLYLTGSFSDANHVTSVTAAEIVDGDVNFANPLYQVYESNNVVDTLPFKVDVTDRLGETIVLSSIDSGYNESVMGVRIPTEARSVMIQEESAQINVGETYDVLSVSDEGVGALTWSSSNEAVATVDAHGRVSGVTAGYAVITVSPEDGIGDSIIIVVDDPSIAATDIILSVPNYMELEVGDGAMIEALAVLPETALKNVNEVSWRVDDPAGLSLHAYGSSAGMEANGVGEYILSVSHSGFTKEVSVTVRPATSLPTPEFNVAYLVLNKGETLNLAIDTSSLTDTDVLWTAIGDTENYEFDSDGSTATFVGHDLGEYILKASTDDGERVWRVRVISPIAEDFGFEDQNLEMVVGTTATPGIFVEPADALEGLIVTSYDSEIAELSDGVVSALTVGETMLRVSSNDGRSDILPVRVIPANRQALVGDVAIAQGYDEANYTASSWAALQAQITQAQAVIANMNASQAEIDAAQSALNGAIADLVMKITGVNDSYEITVGATLALNPSPQGGTWEYDTTFLTKVEGSDRRRASGIVLRAESVGTTSVVYTSLEGESRTLSVVIKAQDKPTVPVEPTEPTDPSDPTDPEKPVTPPNPTNPDLPGTGIGDDTSQSTIALVLVGIGVVTLVGVGLYRRKESNKE